ncbi:MAG: 2-hydroxyacyl-CoA dehydratase [Clostridia bacterium]|nr:2-hydroxyacyl-CoA dehydratase [Clostridia bacterium]
MEKKLDNGRIEFTKKMKKDYTILFPNMLDIHFRILKKVFESFGYNVDMLSDSGRAIVDEGLKYVHNDTCYPALLTIGQMMHALKSGKYDLNKTALMMTQTGGGCRASNYIHLIRKALKSAGMEYIPVISVNISGLERNSGFQITLPMLRRALGAITYGDLLMLISNQLRPYECERGSVDALVEKWVNKISEMFDNKQGFTRKEMKVVMAKIVESFDKIRIERRPIPKVGIVGEIYVKYSGFANNHLEKFLAGEGCEVMVPGLMGFLLFKVDNRIEDIALYGGSRIKKTVVSVLYNLLEEFEALMINSVKGNERYIAPAPYRHLKEIVTPLIGRGCKMGEGWLLTAEMVELIESGYPNIVCAQPFGCLPNHIVGKGMIRHITELWPNANIVPVDYDPGATEVNQENRIKLMLSIARENLTQSEKEKVISNDSAELHAAAH